MSRERDLMRDELTPKFSGGGRGDGAGGGVSHSRRLAARLALRPSVRGGRGVSATLTGYKQALGTQGHS